MLAEDNPINQKLALSLLGKQEWKVKAVENGKLAIEALEKESFNLVLMDVQMPVMDGFAATQAIRNQEKQSGQHMPIVAMTAHAMQGDREKCLSTGMDDYISKPMKAKELYAIVAKMVNHHVSQNNEQVTEFKEETVKPGVDLSNVMEALDGDIDLLKDLIHDFLEEIPKQLNDLQTCIESQNSKSIERKAHSLKGAVANFGARHAYEAANELEIAGRDAKLDVTESLFNKLQHELHQLNQYFASSEWEAGI